MDAKPNSPRNAFPTQLVDAVALDAARDADAVGLFLRQLGLSATPTQPRRLPQRFLVYLAAALRLLDWERQGFGFHHAAGLPSARLALDDAFRTLHDADADPSELCVSLLRLTLERFAWNGPRELDADIALDDLSDEATLDMLAEFFWASRHLATAKEDCQP